MRPKQCVLHVGRPRCGLVQSENPRNPTAKNPTKPKAPRTPPSKPPSLPPQPSPPLALAASSWDPCLIMRGLRAFTGCRLQMKYRLAGMTAISSSEASTSNLRPLKKKLRNLNEAQESLRSLGPSAFGPPSFKLSALGLGNRWAFDGSLGELPWGSWATLGNATRSCDRRVALLTHLSRGIRPKLGQH